MTDLTTASSRSRPYEDLRVMIGRMDGKLDIVLATAVDHGKRLTELEAWRHRQDDLPRDVHDLSSKVALMEAWKNRWLGWTFASAVLGGAATNADRIINLLTN